jgi:hypothetical protein
MDAKSSAQSAMLSIALPAAAPTADHFPPTPLHPGASAQSRISTSLTDVTASLCQQGAKTIVPALLRGQHHHPGRGIMPDVEGVAGARLKSFTERIERLEEEKRALGEDIKEVFAAAKGTGFEP